jgi:hypothetical protein
MLPGVDSRDRAGSCLSIDDVDLQQSFDIQIRESFPMSPLSSCKLTGEWHLRHIGCNDRVAWAVWWFGLGFALTITVAQLTVHRTT